QCNAPDKIHPLTLLVVEHEDGQRINWLARCLEILQEPEMKEILALLPKHQQQMVCHAEEWIAEGWGLEGDPTPEQIVAALLMEANTQDAMVKTGDSHASYPQELRQLAYNILSYCQPKMFSHLFADELLQDED